MVFVGQFYLLFSKILTNVHQLTSMKCLDAKIWKQNVPGNGCMGLNRNKIKNEIFSKKPFVYQRIVFIFKVFQQIFMILGMYVEVKETFNLNFKNGVHWNVSTKMTGKRPKTKKIAVNNFFLNNLLQSAKKNWTNKRDSLKCVVRSPMAFLLPLTNALQSVFGKSIILEFLSLLTHTTISLSLALKLWDTLYSVYSTVSVPHTREDLCLLALNCLQ